MICWKEFLTLVQSVVVFDILLCVLQERVLDICTISCGADVFVCFAGKGS